ncbi:hypothetical protein BC628DRAFT_1406035 [Trametes gibbosa]|nr:hypothetical protein BC628DRAFT_1406035 [Trametes gibbosa]
MFCARDRAGDRQHTPHTRRAVSRSFHCTRAPTPTPLRMRLLLLLTAMSGTLVAAAACSREPSLVDRNLAVHLQYFDSAAPTSTPYPSCQDVPPMPTILIIKPPPRHTTAPLRVSVLDPNISNYARPRARARSTRTQGSHNVHTYTWADAWQKVRSFLWAHRHFLREEMIVL